MSWASLLLNFGPCVDRCSDTASSFIPCHNSAYIGSLLLVLWRQTELLPGGRGSDACRLEQKGHKLCVAAGARTAHLNVNTSSSVWYEQYWGARLFWALRTRQEPWGAVRRIALTAITPGLLIIRVARAMRESRRVGFPLKRTPALIVAVWAGSLAITAGAIAGMLLGEGQSLARRVPLELDRRSHLQLQDRVLLPDG